MSNVVELHICKYCFYYNFENRECTLQNRHKTINDFCRAYKYSNLCNLMIDYNLTWGAVYNIVKESIEKVNKNE